MPQLNSKRVLFPNFKRKTEKETGKGVSEKRPSSSLSPQGRAVRHAAVSSPAASLAAPPCRSWIRGPEALSSPETLAPLPYLRLHLSSLPRLLLLLPAASAAAPCRHSGHPGARPTPPPAPHRCLLPPRTKNQAGVPGVAASVLVFPAPAAARRTPPRRRPSNTTASPPDLPRRLRPQPRTRGELAPLLAFFSLLPSLSTAPHERHRRPPLDLVAGTTPATIWSSAAAPDSPFLPLAPGARPRTQFRSKSTNR